MSLDRLAPELLFMILQSTDSPLDLYHLISASPSCFRAFSRSPELVLSSVIRNALPGNNVRHALAILQAPSTKPEISSFLSDFYFNDAFSFDFPTSKEGILRLYHVYNRCCYLLNGFCERAMRELGIPGQQSPSCGRDEQRNDGTQKPPAHLPSWSELTRLQRAFFRFFLYCQVFPGHEDDPYGSVEPSPPLYNAHQQFSLFLAHLPPWEVEEMCCVEQYLSALVEEFIDELEEDLISAVIATPGVVLPTALSTLHQAPEAPAQGMHQSRLVEFEALDLTDLYLFSYDGRYSSPRYISYMSSLGLEFVYSLVKLDKRKRTELIRSNHPVTREFLPEALATAPRRTNGPKDEDEGAKRGVLDDDDNPACMNVGYRLFNKAPKNVRYMGITDVGFKYSRVRELGYVFWDSGRISSPDVFKKFSAAKAMTSQERQLRFDRRNRKTAEDRLKGTKLPREEMERIEQEFGTTLFSDR